MDKLMKQISAIFVDNDVLYKMSLLHPALYTVCFDNFFELEI